MKMNELWNWINYEMDKLWKWINYEIKYENE